jgi:hypothetical protein
MKSSWGNVRIITTKHDRLVYGYIPKKYTRKTPYPSHIIRVPILKREKATIIKLRKLGYPMNMIHKALGRSLSFIHRTLTAAQRNLCLRKMDLRKLPKTIRNYTSRKRWINLQKYLPSWERFLLGESEKPP